MTEEDSLESDDPSRIRAFLLDQLAVLQEHLGTEGHCDMQAVLRAAQQISGMAVAVMAGETGRLSEFCEKPGGFHAS